MISLNPKSTWFSSLSHFILFFIFPFLSYLLVHLKTVLEMLLFLNTKTVKCLHINETCSPIVMHKLKFTTYILFTLYFKNT